jgi:type I restriction enzyme S subunit
VNWVDELVRTAAPEGVPRLRLGEVVRIRNGRDYKSLGPGPVPVYGTGGIMAYVDTAAYAEPSVLIPRKGSLNKLYYVDKPFWTVDTIFYTEIGDRILPKFLYYFLATQRLEEMNKAGGIPSLTQSELNAVAVPVPPLDVQLEVVRILDHFTELQAELQAELEARRHQYAFYRAALLASRHDVGTPTASIGEALSLRAGKFVAAPEIVSDRDEAHPVPCFGGNGLRGYVAQPNHDGDHVIIGRQGALSGNVRRVRGEFYATEHAVVVTPRQPFDTSWLFHVLTEMNLGQYVSKGAQPGLAVNKLNAITIPIPPLSEQVRIGGVLDKFDALVNDLSIGLPAELVARRQQYEYYRDELLTFPEAAA